MTLHEKSLFAGIDVGSRTTKAVLFDGRTILSSVVMNTGIDTRMSAEKAYQSVKETAGVTDREIQKIVGTGYGRVSIEFAHQTITELTCHARGCYFINDAIRTVIDIGGQDSKIIRLDPRGNMFDFVMNDKCAAGTGKFLEMAARALETDTESLNNGHVRPPVTTKNERTRTADRELFQINPHGLRPTTSNESFDMAKPINSFQIKLPETDSESNIEPCVINSMCAVFAESEIISLISKGEPRANIIAGIHQSFATRVGNMGKRLGIQEPVAFVGGVAKNKGLAKALSEYLNVSFIPLSVDPQIMGALGAAVSASFMAVSASSIQ